MAPPSAPQAHRAGAETVRDREVRPWKIEEVRRERGDLRIARAAGCATYGSKHYARRIRLAVLICNGHDTFHSKHHRLHLGFRQDANSGLHAVAAFPAVRDR